MANQTPYECIGAAYRLIYVFEKNLMKCANIIQSFPNLLHIKTVI